MFLNSKKKINESTNCGGRQHLATNSRSELSKIPKTQSFGEMVSNKLKKNHVKVSCMPKSCILMINLISTVDSTS